MIGRCYYCGDLNLMEPLMNNPNLAQLITTHLERYPHMDTLDVYKLLHQAVFGPGQVIKNQKAAREWLERESGLLKPAAEQVLVESVHPEDEIVRLHLRPYLAEQGSLAQLLVAYAESSWTVQGTFDMMRDYWSSFEAMLQHSKYFNGHFDPRNTLLTGKVRAEEKWSNSHHSPQYNHYYKPVYRVLLREQAESLLKRQGISFEIV
jgi:hypothetical protein